MTDVNIITNSQFTDFAPEVDQTKYTPATVSGVISQASKQISDYLGYNPLAEDIVDETIQAYIDSNNDLLIFPSKIPVQSVSAIALTKGTTTLNLTLTDSGNNKYNVDYTKRNIRYPANELSIGSSTGLIDFNSLKGIQFYVKLSYRAGFEVSALPASIQLACVQLVKDLLSGQYNTTGARKVTQGGISIEYSSGDSRLSKSVKNLLNPYRRI